MRGSNGLSKFTNLLRTNYQINACHDKFFHTSLPSCKVFLKNAKIRKTSSRQWLKRQVNDPYIVQSRLQQWRCRSAFKLLQIDDKYHLLKQGDVVIDCGAFPGSWSQVAVKRVNATGEDGDAKVGSVISVDKAQMVPLPGAQIVRGDFTSPDIQEKISKILSGKQVCVVLSDMAPNASGMKSMDHEIIVHLARTTLTFSQTVLKLGGHFVCKLWDGSETKALENEMKKHFVTVKRVIPDACRQDSSELYLIGIKHKYKEVKS